MLHATVFFITFIITGSLGGFCAGFFGLGGGVLYIPVFLTLFNYLEPSSQNSMHVAVGTSLALIVPASLAASIRQYRQGNINLALVKPWVSFVFIGTLLGAVIIRYIPSFELQIIFNVFLYLAIALTVIKNFRKSSEVLPVKQIKMLLLGGYAVFTGAVSVLLGIGGGTVTMPFLKLLNYPYPQAVTTSSLGGVVIGIVGTLLMIISGWSIPNLPAYSLGYVNWLGFICVFPLAMLTAPLGARLSHVINDKTATWLFISVLFALSVYMTFKILMVSL